MSLVRKRSLQVIALLAVLALVIAGCTPATAQPAPATTAPATTAPTAAAPTAAATAVASPTVAVEASPLSPTAQPTVAAAPTASTSASPLAPTTQPTSAAGMQPVEPNELTFKAMEYSFEAPPTVPGGWTRVTLQNEGELPHDVQLFQVEVGKTITDVMQALQGEGPPSWVTLFGGVEAEAGASASYLVDLAAGNYYAISFGQQQDGPPDAMRGMVHQFTVTAPDAATAVTLPEADAIVDMADFAFVISGTLEAGEQVLRVNNVGKEMHELVAFRLNEGVTFDEFKRVMEAEMAGTPMPEDQAPPFTDVAFTMSSPGVSTFITVDFEAGNHIFICFIPSPGNQMRPHFDLGMVQEVTIK